MAARAEKPLKRGQPRRCRRCGESIFWKGSRWFHHNIDADRYAGPHEAEPKR